MKLSVALIAAVTADDKKVPPRHPLQRLERLTEFSAEILNDWFDFVPSKDRWIQKFANNADRMERNFNRGNQRCGFYDADQLPHGGPARKRRSDDFEDRYNREDPCHGIKQITTGYRKWAERYLSQCSGQKNEKYQVNRMNKWYGILSNKLECDNAPEYPVPAGYEVHNTEFGTIYTRVYDDFYTAGEARALCAADADFVHLPIPDSPFLNQWYFDFIGTRSDRDMWLGINDSAEEGTWRTDLGGYQTYFNWNGNEPNDYGSGEDNVEMILSGNANQNGKWNDMLDRPSTQEDRVAYGNNNLVVCTFIVPDSAPPSRCPVGWIEETTSEGQKCLMVNKGKFKIETAVAQCNSSGSELALPKNEEDNRLFADLIGYGKYDLWIAASDADSEGRPLIYFLLKFHIGIKITQF